MKRALWIVAVVVATIVGFWFSWKRQLTPAAEPAGGDTLSEPAPAFTSRREPVAVAPTADEPAAVAARPAGLGAGEATSAAGPSRTRTSELNDAAIAALGRGELETAVELFERCHERAPAEDVFRRNLAEALARLAQQEYERADAASFALALEHLARAVQLAPERATLAERLARWRRVEETERGFWTDASEHFELAYDGDRSELLWSSFQMLHVLEAAYQDFGELFVRYPVEGGRSKIRVVLYRRAEFDAITGIGHWAGGVFDGTVRVPIEDLGREESALRRVLRHELVHVFVRSIGGSCAPSWLDEGLAQWLEVDGAAQRAPRVARARAALAGVELHDLERLRSGLAGWSDPDEIRRAYSEALAFVSWIDGRFGERVAFELVRACGAAEGVQASFRTLTGVALQDAWREFGDGL